MPQLKSAYATRPAAIPPMTIDGVSPYRAARPTKHLALSPRQPVSSQAVMSGVESRFGKAAHKYLVESIYDWIPYDDGPRDAAAVTEMAAATT